MIKLVMSVIVLAFVTASAIASPLISYQGRLASLGGTPVADGDYNAIFRLYPDSAAASPIWSESAVIQTSGGLFDHNLGSVMSLPPDIAVSSPTLFLEIQIESEIVLPRIRLASAPTSLGASGLAVADSSNNLMITTVSNDGTLLFLNPITGDTTITLRSTYGGDSAVVLPDGAISSIEILNEAGATWNTESSILTLGTGTMSDLVTISVEIPDEGYIMLFGKCYVMLSGTTGPNGAQIQIDDNQGGPAHYPYYQHVGMSGFVNAGLNYFPVMASRIFYRPAGSYTFRLEGLATHAAPAVAESWDHILLAQYFPTDISAPFKTASFIPEQSNGEQGDTLSPEERYKRAKAEQK